MQSTFMQAMIDFGLTPPDHIIEDGIIHRFSAPDDKRRSKPCWYVCYGSGGAFGSWKTGLSGKWHDNSERSIREERKLTDQIKEEQRKQKQERTETQRRAALSARSRWKNAVDVIKHPYLSRKQVKAIGIRQEGKNLIIPVRINNGLTSVQLITPDGEKFFHKGGEVAGGYFSIGKISDCIYICEGYSTGISLYAETRQAVAVAFNAGNLKPVALALRKKYPNIQIIIAADNDSKVDGNPGLTKAKEAARIIKAQMIYPRFDDESFEGSDWNDYLTQGGIL